MYILLLRPMLSLLGALLILIAYAGQQFHWMDVRRTPYNLLNGMGSALLAYIAFHPFQIGFLVLELSWTLISLYALARVWKRQ